MIAVIFEFTPAPGRKQEYLDLAAALAPELERADGFVSIERFESISQPGRFVSLSFWRDEQALAGWRNLSEHRKAQAKGRGGIFAGYRLRVAGVLRDYGHAQRAQAPADSVAFHG
ncbi:MAG TPA: antibiotic biosynthesis monooxygenase [Burkholderiales bacterium]|nr:antibiotic biosynthesis monooxygenase [Burkholderiales bacterium]